MRLAAVALCCPRSATAFFVSSSPHSSYFSALASRATSTVAAVDSLSEASSLRQAEKQHRNGARAFNSMPGNSHGRATSALRVIPGGFTDAESALKKLMAEDFGANVEVDTKRVAVLFDFDGTIGDTETPAMEVAFWELAPYFPAAASEFV